MSLHEVGGPILSRRSASECWLMDHAGRHRQAKNTPTGDVPDTLGRQDVHREAEGSRKVARLGRIANS
jgi:hypothetical protein